MGVIKAQFVVSEVERIAVGYHDVVLRAGSVIAFHHFERLFVADKADIRVVFANERQRTRVVGLHVVYDEVIDGAVANHSLDFV